MIILLRFLCFFLTLSFLFPVNAYAGDYTISASSYVVLDADTKTVLYEKSSNSVCSMASTTKIMTCLIACESERLDDTIVITNEMLDGAIGSLIYLNVGDEITVLDLIKGAMLASGNDAANSLAVTLGGSIDSFVRLMNERAKKIGMNNTNFVTPSGLDEGDHHSTAYDMALLSVEAMKNDTFKGICALKSAVIKINGKPQTIYNHNKLLSHDGFVGIKTGFTEKAGRCLISSYNYRGNNIIVVTLNAPNDWEDHRQLIVKAKKKYKHYKDKFEANINVVGGYKDVAYCNATYNAYSLSEISYVAYYYPFVYAPISCETVVGKLDIYSDSKKIMTVDITVKEDVKLWQITK